MVSDRVLRPERVLGGMPSVIVASCVQLENKTSSELLSEEAANRMIKEDIALWLRTE